LLYLIYISQVEQGRAIKQKTKKWGGLGNVLRVGHLLYWGRKLKQYSIKTPLVNDKTTKTRVWECKFKVLDFESTRNNAKGVFNTFTCYTDGSHLKSHSGFGYVIKKFNRIIYEGNEYLGPKATVFQAKIIAITTVCQILKQRRKQVIKIKCDSQAAIQAVLATNIISKTVLDCRKALNALGEVNDVTISWIKSHVEHPGNDLADKQAKAGTIPRQGPGPWHWHWHPVPTSFFKMNVKLQINEQWQKRWIEKPEVCWQSKCFIQNIAQNVTKFDKLLKSSNIHTIGLLVQFITGHCNLNYHQKKLIKEHVGSAKRRTRPLFI
jgi:ribonuclease HI